MIGFISNILLNLYSTVFIATRLLLHRRMIVNTLGRAAPEMHHLRIVTILLESAAINIPITIVAAVGFAFGRVLGNVALPIVTACQSFASVLILHQVALGRAIGQQDGTESYSDSRRNHVVDTWISE
ncbi:hypothetical protein P691DRAFT_453596 [Macrolepiota fuliginosa MF-IS2]|uniref:Uncharacterized protein n=1 Tax=Macrolepiota fuliginosa MF-IS2 TaxID=1400762 RepID=A0A9P6C3X3_9AGAR|nr:hypothetical protein P691DRAFT_453596 [Macrolepiota fuliginosa MF-IS2]